MITPELFIQEQYGETQGWEKMTKKSSIASVNTLIYHTSSSDPRMLPCTPNLTTLAGQPTQALGFGNLCRYFYKALRDDFEDYTAHNVKDKECDGFDYSGYFVACHTHD